MNDSIAEEPQQLTSSVSVGGEDRNKSIAALSVSQICKLTRPTEGLIIHKKKIHHVNLVAYVAEIIDKTPQKLHILVDDYTSGGPLEVSHIIADSGTPDDMNMFNVNMDGKMAESDTRHLQSLELGDYVRLIGVVKYMQDKPTFVAYNVKIIEDPNDVTVHYLEVIRDSMYYERLASGSLPTNDDATKAPMANPGQRDEFGNLSNRDKHVLKILKEKGGDKGVFVKDICTSLRAFSEAEIRDSLQTMSAEGLCWEGDEVDLWCS